MTDTAQMMTDAYRLKTAIEREVVEVEENGIKIIIGGDLKIKEVFVNELQDNTMKDVVNKAIRKAQEVMVLKMKEMSLASDIK